MDHFRHHRQLPGHGAMRADSHPWHPGILPPGTAWPGFLSGTSIRTSQMPMSTTCCSRTSSSGPTMRSRWLPTTAPGWASTAVKSPSGRYREVSGDRGRCFSFSKVCACGILYSPSPNVGFPGGSDGKESTCHAGDLGLIPGLGRSPGEGEGYALQYSGLENSMICTVHGVPQSWTQLSDFHSQQQNVLIFKNKILTTRFFLFVLVQESQFQVSRVLTQ